MKSYMKSKTHIPRTKKCDSCGKEVLLAGYNCHVQKCVKYLNHKKHQLSVSNNDDDIKKASMRDFDRMIMKKLGNYKKNDDVNSPHNNKFFNKSTKKSTDFICCKHCSVKIPQRNYLIHMNKCIKASKYNARQNPNGDFRTGVPPHNIDAMSLRRQTPLEMSKTSTEEKLKANAFIQETLQAANNNNSPSRPGSRHGSRPGSPSKSMSRPTSGLTRTPSSCSSLPISRPRSAYAHASSSGSSPQRSRPNSGYDRTASRSSQIEKPGINRGPSSKHVAQQEKKGGINDAQIEFLEKKIAEIEQKLAPHLRLQQAVKSKLMPFHVPKKPQPKLKRGKSNKQTLSNSTTARNLSKKDLNGKDVKFSKYPPLPRNFTNPPPEEYQKCEHCNRTFSEKAFQKHSEICLRVFVGKRPFYDSARARMKGTSMELFYWKSRRTTSGNGSRRPRSAPKTRRNVGTYCDTKARNHSHKSRLPSDHYSQLRSSTASTGAKRNRINNAYSSQGKYFNPKKNYGLFSLRLNLFETPPEPISSNSGGCRVVSANNWRARSREFREAITAARVLYYAQQCSNQLKC